MPRPYLILPVENQVRELDAKILLACVAAQQGYASIIGWRGLVDARIGRFPPSVYLAKSMSRENTKMFRINRKLGHTIIAWDEEAVVHYPAQVY
jgi:surface carbohydrate biosynthesis protein